MFVLLLLVAFGLLVVGLGLAAIPGYFALRFRKRRTAIAGTREYAVAHLRPGPAKVKGRVVAREPLLRSPMSRSDCVYYHFTVAEQRTTRHGRHVSTYWHEIVSDRRSIDVAIDDGSGEVDVVLEGAEVVLESAAHLHSSLFNDPPERLRRLLAERYGQSTKGWFFNKTLQFKEAVLEEGAEVVVVGEARRSRGQVYFRSGETPLVVSDKSERSLGSHYKWREFLCWGGSALILLFFLVGAGFATVFAVIFAAGGPGGGPSGPGPAAGPGAAGNRPVQQAPAPPTLDQLLADLRSPDPETRRKAARTLAGRPLDPARRKEVAGALDPLLRGDADDVRAALEAARVWNGPELVPALAALLEQGNRRDQFSVINALAATKDRAAADALAKEMVRTNFRAACSQALKQMGPVAEPSVLPLVEHREIGVRFEAVRVLKEVGTKDSLPALRRGREDVGLRRTADEAIAAIEARGR
jgi:hypothetical protein